MIVVTGAAGFIGSCLVSRLNKAGYNSIIVVDDFSKTEKNGNLEGKTISAKVGRKDFISWLEGFGQEIDFIYHIGARTDTAEFDKNVFDELGGWGNKFLGATIENEEFANRINEKSKTYIQTKQSNAFA